MLTIIGCGNPVRSDDGAGIAVVQHLSRLQPSPDAARLIDAGTAGMEVMYQVREAGRVVIVDACRSGSPAGSVFRLPGSEAATPAGSAFTLHGLRWDHALHAGRCMYGEDFLRRVEVFLIEAQSLDFGERLSAPVERGVARVVDEIRALFEAPEVWLRAGRLHLSHAACERHLPGCAAVGLLARDGEWLLLPLRAGAGGIQIKRRNAAGDRVIEAQEFFRAQGLEDSPQTRALHLLPDAQRGLLRIVFASSADAGLGETR